MSRYVTASEPGPAALGAVPQAAALTTLFHPRLPARLSVERVAHEFPTMLSSRDPDPCRRQMKAVPRSGHPWPRVRSWPAPCGFVLVTTGAARRRSPVGEEEDHGGQGRREG